MNFCITPLNRPVVSRRLSISSKTRGWSSFQRFSHGDLVIRTCVNAEMADPKAQHHQPLGTSGRRAAADIHVRFMWMKYI